MNVCERLYSSSALCRLIKVFDFQGNCAVPRAYFFVCVLSCRIVIVLPQVHKPMCHSSLWTDLH